MIDNNDDPNKINSSINDHDGDDLMDEEISNKEENPYNDILNKKDNSLIDDVDNDKEIDREDDRGLIEQNSSVIVWEIEGLYDNDGKLLKPRVLKNKPPTLIVSDGVDNEVSFLLTKNLSMHLNGALNQVYNAYYGISPKNSDNPGSLMWNIKRSAPFLVIVALLIVAFILSNFF